MANGVDLFILSIHCLTFTQYIVQCFIIRRVAASVAESAVMAGDGVFFQYCTAFGIIGLVDVRCTVIAFSSVAMVTIICGGKSVDEFRYVDFSHTDVSVGSWLVYVITRKGFFYVSFVFYCSIVQCVCFYAFCYPCFGATDEY